MPRLMSFEMTVAAIRKQTKTVTRRIGWRMLRPGDLLIACNRSPRTGNGYQRIATLRVVKVTREPLDAITAEDVVREGFPFLPPEMFVTSFCQKMRCDPDTPVTRIEFEYVESRDA